MSSDRPLLSPRRVPDLAATTTTPVRIRVRVASGSRNHGRLTCRTQGWDRDRSHGTCTVRPCLEVGWVHGCPAHDPRRLTSDQCIYHYGCEEKQYGRGDGDLAADGAVVGGTFRLPCCPSLVEIRRLRYGRGYRRARPLRNDWCVSDHVPSRAMALVRAWPGRPRAQKSRRDQYTRSSPVSLDTNVSHFYRRGHAALPSSAGDRRNP